MMTMIRPRVSIILPVYNGARFLSRSILSVSEQTFQDWELIIIDDGSKDESGAIARAAALKDIRIKYVFQVNAGIQKALNSGLSLAQGNYIARIDDDDVWLVPDKLRFQVAFLDAHPDYVLLGTATCVLDESGVELFRYRLPESDAAIRLRMLRKNNFVHSSVVFRRDVAERAGRYGETNVTRHVEDYDLWLRMGRLGKLANLPVFATGLTLRPDNISSINKISQLEKDLGLVRAYRNDYSGYPFAIFYGYLRLLGYRLFRVLPNFLKKRFLKVSREI